MAKRIKYSAYAIADRVAILDYWFQRIGNKNYSKKLDFSLKEIINKLSEYPKLGRQLDNREERFFVKDSYQIFMLKRRILFKYFIFGIAGETRKI